MMGRVPESRRKSIPRVGRGSKLLTRSYLKPPPQTLRNLIPRTLLNATRTVQNEAMRGTNVSLTFKIARMKLIARKKKYGVYFTR